jgi:putative peptidoglycan lipid II flippase
LSFFMLGLVAHAVLPVMARAFYARQDTLTPVAAAVLTVIVNSSLAVALAGPFGLAGIATSFTVAAWIEALVLRTVLHRRLPAVDVGALGRLLAVSGGLTLLASVGAELVLDTVLGPTRPTSGQLSSAEGGIIGGASFALIFLAGATLLRIPELTGLAGTLAGALGRSRP